MSKPRAGEFASYYERYINLVEADDVSEAVSKYSESLVEFFENIPEDKAGYRYAENKWSLKEMLQHIIDAERVFSYRVLCFARKDSTPLPGFDENDYAGNSNADARNWSDLLEEFKAARKSTDLLYTSLGEEQLQQTGISNNNPSTAKSTAFVTFGHILHHRNIIVERYL